jgi:hypothetical protein
MTIQIDDQGWGTPVGGVGIIVVRKETDDLHYDIVPIELFDLTNIASLNLILNLTAKMPKRKDI